MLYNSDSIPDSRGRAGEGNIPTVDSLVRFPLGLPDECCFQCASTILSPPQIFGPQHALPSYSCS